jgi:hypothetical protein
MAETQHRRKKRWIVFAALTLGLPFTWFWLNRATGPRVVVDSELALYCVEFEEGSRFVRSGWSTDRDRDEQDDILVLYSSPSRLNLLQTVFQWKRVFRPNTRHVIRMSSADGAELGTEDFLGVDSLRLHVAQDGRSCFHQKPNGGNLEVCSDPGQCCAPDPKVRIALPGQEYEAFMEERGTEMFFVLEDRTENELVLREKLGQFARLYDWPAMREQGRCLLYYGAYGSWEELSEVRLRENEQDDRWPITTEKLGVPDGTFFPLHATVDTEQTSQLLAVWETPIERIFLRLGLADDLEVEQLGKVPRGVTAHGQFGAPICAVPQGDDFFIVHARALGTAPYSLVLDVKLPGQEFHEVALPVDLDDYDFGAISMVGGRVHSPYHGPQQVILQPIADQDGDQAHDWHALIRVGGCRGGLIVCFDLSGATGQALKR